MSTCRSRSRRQRSGGLVELESLDGKAASRSRPGRRAARPSACAGGACRPCAFSGARRSARYGPRRRPGEALAARTRSARGVRARRRRSNRRSRQGRIPMREHSSSVAPLRGPRPHTQSARGPTMRETLQFKSVAPLRGSTPPHAKRAGPQRACRTTSAGTPAVPHPWGTAARRFLVPAPPALHSKLDAPPPSRGTPARLRSLRSVGVCAPCRR
jgi:hypothetical protein